MKLITVKAKIKDKVGPSVWEEEFEVGSIEHAAAQVRRVVDQYNAGCQLDIHKREFVEIVGSTESEIGAIDAAYHWNSICQDVERFMYYADRQNNNAYGNAGIKANFSKIKGARSKFMRGIYGDFCKYVKEHKRDAYNDLTLLADLTKEQYKQARKIYKEQ